MPGRALAADPPQAVAAVRDQRVDQRVVRIARRRMHHEPRRLVDDDHVLVLVNDVERHRLGLRTGRHDLRLKDPVALARLTLREGSVTFAPPQATAPSAINACSRVRDSVGKASARKRSRRRPAWVSSTVAVEIVTAGLEPKS